MAKPSKQAGTASALASFGQAVRTVRLKQGISQEALADLAGVDRSYMGGIERGEHNLTVMNLLRIADQLGIKPSELFERAGL